MEETGCQLRRPTVKSERRRDTVGMEWKNEKGKIPNWSKSERLNNLQVMMEGRLLVVKSRSFDFLLNFLVLFRVEQHPYSFQSLHTFEDDTLLMRNELVYFFITIYTVVDVVFMRVR